MFISKRVVGIEEYDCAVVRTVDKALKIIPLPLPQPKRSIEFHPLRIAGEWAKSVHAGPLPGILDLALAKVESTVTSQRLTAVRYSWGACNLRLRVALCGNDNGIRDFSKSNRIGEYGQAICLVFIQDTLGYPIVYDFDAFCDVSKIARLPKNAKKPDFVGVSGTQVALVESKASLGSNSIKTELREGLLQCDAGHAHLANMGGPIPASGYCALTSFQLEYAMPDTALHFADPSYDGVLSDSAWKNLADIYYRRALLVFGCDDDFDELLRRPAEAGIFFFPGIEERRFIKLSVREKPEWLTTNGHRFGRRNVIYTVWFDVGILKALHTGDGQVFRDQTAAYRQAVTAFEASQRRTRSIVQAYRDGLFIHIDSDSFGHPRMRQAFSPSPKMRP